MHFFFRPSDLEKKAFLNALTFVILIGFSKNWKIFLVTEQPFIFYFPLRGCNNNNNNKTPSTPFLFLN